MREVWLTETCFFIVLFLQKTIIGLLHGTTQASTKYIQNLHETVFVLWSVVMWYGHHKMQNSMVKILPKKVIGWKLYYTEPKVKNLIFLSLFCFLFCATFLMYSKSATNSAFFCYPYWNFFKKNLRVLLALFANFKVEFGRNGSKNEKNVFINWS